MFWLSWMRHLFIVYCNLQSTQLDRVISKVEVRKGREAGTIHRWFTGGVLLLPAIVVWVVCRLRGSREFWSVDYCAQCCGFCIYWRWFEPLPLRTGYRSPCAKFGWRGTRENCWSFWAFLTGMCGGSWCWMACCIPIALSRRSRWVVVLPCIRLVCCLGIAVNVRLWASSCFWI